MTEVTRMWHYHKPDRESIESSVTKNLNHADAVLRSLDFLTDDFNKLKRYDMVRDSKRVRDEASTVRVHLLGLLEKVRSTV